MASVAEGWILRRPKSREIYEVRFTVRGQRYELSTGQRDRGAAAVEAQRLYTLALAGGLGAPAPGKASTRPLLEVAAEWLASLATTHDETTRGTYEQYAARWCRRWATLADVTRAALGAFVRERLGEVTRSSVQKEASALRGLLLWCEEQGLIPVAPPPPVLPPKATGTRATTRPEGTTALSPAQVSAILAHLPEWSSEREGAWRVRDYFLVAAETGLRPATLAGLRWPEHWRPGARELQIPAELDKARWGRVVPLSAAAVEALTRCRPASPGLLLGRHDRRDWLRDAARAAGLPPELARRVVPYDLRHARATELLAAGAAVPGVQHLLGHRQLGTTSRYTHPGAEHARAALATVAPAGPIGGIVGAQGLGGPWCEGSAATIPQPKSPDCAKGGT
jgi:integrase/recombinase XerD